MELDFLKAIIQTIIDKQHVNPIKRQLKVMPTVGAPEKINFSCPICGDSEKDPNKKRGNLYLNSLFYQCFNCGIKKPFLDFAEDFGVELDADKKIELQETIQNAIEKAKWIEDEQMMTNLDKILDLNDIIDYYNNNDESKMTNLRPVTKGSVVYKYLNDRKIFDHDSIMEATWWHTDDWYEPVLININMSLSNKVLGIQLRNLKTKGKQRFFKVIPFSELYFNVKGVHLDDVEAGAYDKLSYLYNILKVDWSKPITVFEGFLDTKFFPNSIGCVGTNTDLTFLKNQEADLRFFYDHDGTGIKKTKQFIKDGESVFLWDKFFEELSMKSKKPDVFLMKLNETIIDLNDLAKKIDNPYNKLKLEKYFSIDEMDIMYVKDMF